MDRAQAYASTSGRRTTTVSSRRESVKPAAYIPESEVLRNLHETEAKIDMMLHKRRIDYLKTVSHATNTFSNPCKYRVYLFTTHQPATAHEPASWALHVRARALTTDEPPQEIPVFPAFSSFLRSLDIEIAPPTPEADPSAMQVDGAGPSTAPPPSPGGGTARYSWLRERALGAPTDSFEVRRVGSSAGVRVRVRVEMQRDCEDSALSPALADLLGTSLLGAGQVLQRVHQYIEAKGLLKLENGGLLSAFRCDEKLKAVFKADMVRTTDLRRLLQAHLSTPPPLDVEYVLTDPVAAQSAAAAQGGAQASRQGGGNPGDGKSSGPDRTPSNIRCYDMQYLASAPRDYILQAVTEEDRSLEDRYDRPLLELLQKFEDRRRRRAVLQAFAVNPAAFFVDAMEAQALDLRVLKDPNLAGTLPGSSAPPDFVAMDGAALFSSGKWAEEAALRMMFERLRTVTQQTAAVPGVGGMIG